MKTKTTKTTIALYVTEEHKPHEQWCHVRATIVTIGANAWERRCRDDGSYSYPDIKSDTIRNASDDDVNGLYLENLTIACQGNNEDADRRVYAWETRYQQPYSVDTRKALKMAKTLTTIEKRQEKISEKLTDGLRRLAPTWHASPRRSAPPSL